MTLYDYTGQLSTGAAFQGTLEAAGPEEAGAVLAQMGVRVMTLRVARRLAYVAPLSLDEFTFFNEQLAALTKAQLPLEEGLRQLAADVGSRKLKRLLLDLSDELAAGTPLSTALQHQRQRFPPQYAAVVSAGLNTGNLSGTLYGLTTHLRLKSTLRRALLEIGAYPLLILILTFVLSSFVMRTVLPTLRSITADLLAEAGAITARSSMFSGTYVLDWVDVWPSVELVVGLALVTFIVLCALLSLPPARRPREWCLRHIPGVARVYWSSVLARFTHTSALAAFSGTPLPELLAASGQASGSLALGGVAQRVAEKLMRGEALSAAALEERTLPALWTCTVSYAAPRGDLAAALAELARAYELRAQQAVETVRAVLGPLLFLLIALCVGGIIVSLLSAVNIFLRTLMSMMW